MKYNYKQNGGFAGITFGLNGDSQDLPDNYREVLESLLDKPPMIFQATALSKDAFRYHLQLDNAGKINHLDFDDTNIPVGLESLIAYLRERATMAK